ncbi:hypothetical protein [Cellulosimicrobium cellulans]|uniref:hypothetical protein n=1 Tax=Cellulosimicrobium cellulans TaxID=1710 RepID=UPI003C346AA7
MRVARILFVGVVLSAGTLHLSACGSEGVTVPPGSDALSDCEVQQFNVVELESGGEPGCDLEGSSLLFPDGTTLEIGPVGNAASYQDSGSEGVEFSIVNWGIPGVGASITQDGELIDVWASTPEALDLQREQMRIEGVETA